MKVLLYYKYVAVPEPDMETLRHRALCEKLGLKGRILISAEGLNGTCSGTAENIEKYKEALNAHPLFSGIEFKESDHPTHAFAKLFVRLRPEVVTLRAGIEAKDAAPYISPKELHAALEAGEDLVLIDMRNDYEAEIGRFRNAVTLPMKNFRDLPEHMPALKQYEGKKVVTYCTGGIRCEKASALLKEHGFADVRQLEGGIVKYCEEFPDGHFDGSLFVFDDRRAVRFPGKRKPTYVSSCAYCGSESDRHVDCTDDICHSLFVCCPTCEKKCGGYCKKHRLALPTQ
ncbi:MAG: rhodanese-related sulfurtransferase [Candidatus Peribacteraceae bacterium]|nr:rhodanese-related sulfurtransferase [Candidatus Peribacteraceae bacterium]MBP9850741.1 rhodanese-related sulfurtransferase [Candidatus Peribacteraceae bacterium]